MVNLAKLFEMQKALDDRIVREKGLEGQDLLPMKILALQVELGELANEWRGFKFWSNNREPNRSHKVRLPGYTHESVVNEEGVSGLRRVYKYEDSPDRLLEEYVDCLHFILSIGLEINVDDDCFSSPMKEQSVLNQFNTMFNQAIHCYSIHQWYWTFEYFVGLGEMLGFTWDEVEQAYFAKNAVNHERQATGY